MIFAGFGVICFLVGTISMCISGIGTALGIIKPDVEAMKQKIKTKKEKKEQEQDTEDTEDEA